MAACLRSLRLGMPPRVPGGPAGGCGGHLGGATRHARRPAQSISSLHITSSSHKATPAPQQQQQQQQQQQRKVEAGPRGGSCHSTFPFHSFHPLDVLACPSAHTLDDIEVQCLTPNKTQTNAKQATTDKEKSNSGSVRVFCLPPNAIWHPRDATHLKNGAILCSVSYSQLETQVMDFIAHGPYSSQAPPQTPPPEQKENGKCTREYVRDKGVDGGRNSLVEDSGHSVKESDLNWGLESEILGGTKENWDCPTDAQQSTPVTFRGDWDGRVAGHGGLEGYRVNGDGYPATIDKGERYRMTWEGRDECKGPGHGGYGLESSRYISTLGEGGNVCDMALFIKEMGVRKGEQHPYHLAASSLACSSLSSSSSSSSSSSPSSSSSSSGNVDTSGKPSPEQLSFVFNKLAETLPRLFVQPLDYTIYAQDIVFENRIRGTRTIGLFPYVRQVALLRTVGHLRFAYVKFEILKITKHPEEGTVKVRWRIRGLSGLKAILQFYKLKLWNWSSVEDQMISWYDGFSTFHIASDGLVHLHVADSMMPDEEAQIVNTKNSLAVKMAALLGLVPRPSSGSLNTSPDAPAAPSPTAKTAGDICGIINNTEPTTTTTTTTATTTAVGVSVDDASTPTTTTTTATSTTTTTATTCLLGLFDEERDSCAGLMLPLDRIF